MLKIYTYKGCSTCRSALKWLKNNHVAFQEIPIRETPPPVSDLQAMLTAKSGQVRVLFNTSGQDYRTLMLKQKLPEMNDATALRLLSENGNLVKRPFALNKNEGIFLIGFKEPEWKSALCV